MLFYLVVGEFKYLELVRECCLRGLCLCKVVDDFLVWECLLDVCIVEVDNRISVWPRFSLHSIVENDFLFATSIHALYLSVVPHNLIDNF